MKPEQRKKIISAMWITLVSIIGITFVFLFLIYNGVIGYMPDIEELKNPKDRFASIDRKSVV